MSVTWKTGTMLRPPESGHLVGMKAASVSSRKEEEAAQSSQPQLRAPSPSSEPAEYPGSVCTHHTPAPSATHARAQSLISAIFPQITGALTLAGGP